MQDDLEELQGLVAEFARTLHDVRIYVEGARAKAHERGLELDRQEQALRDRLTEIAGEREELAQLKATCDARLAEVERQRKAFEARLAGAASFVTEKLGAITAQQSPPEPKQKPETKPKPEPKQKPEPKPKPGPKPKPDARPQADAKAGRALRLALEHILADGSRMHVRDIVARYKELRAAPPPALDGLALPPGPAQSGFISALRKLPGVKTDEAGHWWLPRA